MNWRQLPAIEELLTIPDRPSVVTVGNFDGVHLGHQHLLSTVANKAELLGIGSLAVTFNPHPIEILRPQDPFNRIVTPEMKIKLIRYHGIDRVATIKFDQEFATLSPIEFLEILSNTTTPQALIVGEGFKFGHQRSGDGETIISYGKKHGFEGIVIDRLANADGIISSSSIRKYVRNGNIIAANLALGRRFVLQGVVGEGVARGRELGYPTANLQIEATQLIPGDGIYAAYASDPTTPDDVFETMVYIGASPTFEDGKRQVEAHLLDYTGDLYTHHLNLEFVEFIRQDMKFDNAEDLVARIARDEEQTRDVLRQTSSELGCGELST